MISNIPNVHEFNKEIPAGKVLIANPGDIEGERRVRREVLATKMAGFKGQTEYKLIAKHAGWNIAGSMMRWDNGSFGVVFEDRNATHGRHFKTYEEAAAAFEGVKAW